MGCNSSKNIQVQNGRKEGSWSNFPLVRTLSRSFSMPPQQQQQFRKARALVTFTYGAIGLGDKYPDFPQSEDDEAEDKPGQKPRVRELELWELLDDDVDAGAGDEQEQVVKQCRKRAKRNNGFNDELGGVHGLPLVLTERNSNHGNGMVFHRASPSPRKPPLVPSTPSASSLRKGLLYGGALKQEAVRSDACRSSGYCTPLEEFGSPSATPRRSLSADAADYVGWCNHKEETLEDSKKSCVTYDDDGGDEVGEVSSVMKHREDQTSMKKQQQRQNGFLRDATNLKDWQQQPSGRISVSRKPGLGLLESFDKRCPPGGDDRVVLYFTSLQSIRKTYEQCRSVKMILDGFFVDVDERDVSIDSEFRNELKELLRGTPGGPVPRLFIRGRYVGGAEEVIYLNENRMIAELLEGLPKVSGRRKACEGCGGIRFIPCMECNGSCKVLDEESDTMVRCEECNENGLTRCPLCY